MLEFVSDHFTDLIAQLQGSSIETISGFFEREIGEGGIVLDTKIQIFFSKNIDAVSSDLIRIQTSLNSDISAFDAHMVAMGRQGMDWIVKSNMINAYNVRAARDLLFSSFKFKPWGAVKLANGLNGALSVLGLAFEAWDSWKEAERIKEFENSRKSLIKNLEEQRRELLEKIKGSNFSAEFFPGFASLQHQIEQLSEEFQRTKERREVFAKWRKNAEVIDGEFKVLKS